MRDFVIVGMVVVMAALSLRSPWIGVMSWTWLSIMNPHRYSWGFAYDAPLAAIAAAATLVGLVITREKRDSPFKGAPVVILAVLTVWITLSWLFGLDPDGDSWKWGRVFKINLMLLVALMVLHSKRHILTLMWVCTMSLALLGAKGGVFTVLTAGGSRVWGPPGSYIEDNNHFALALVMTIPLLRFLQMQMASRWARMGMTVWMILVAAAALGSQSRGALLAISAMASVLWWRGRNRLVAGVVIAIVAVSLVSFMPESWSNRMATINTYEDDRSAVGRFAAWWVAWGIAKNYFFGVGFDASRYFLFDLYSPYAGFGTPAAHSIYFEVMGHHGVIGFLLFVALWFSTFRWAAALRKEAKAIPEARWCHDMASMCQVSLVGYLVGGAFLSMAYFDLPYEVMIMVVLTRLWVRRKAWQTERDKPIRWPWLTGKNRLVGAR